jgi:hypothetical protein
MLGRRELFGALGVATVGVGSSRRALGAAVKTTGPEVLLRRAGVGPGAVFGSCKVIDVGHDTQGAVSVGLQGSDGRRFVLEVLGHDPGTPGVASAGRLAVYVNNRGAGDTATDEEHGLAAMALARHLGRRGAAGAELPELPTLSERSRRAGQARG